MEKAYSRIRRKFHGKLVGTEKLKFYVCKVVSTLPKDVQEYVTEYCWFVGSMDDAWAFTFTGNDLEDQHLIFLSDELMSQDESQIHYSIAHEIGHVVKGHRNSVFIKQSKDEVNQQEIEADDFANQFFPKQY